MKSKFSEFGMIKSILKHSKTPIQYLKPQQSAVSIGKIFNESESGKHQPLLKAERLVSQFTPKSKNL